jgi:hypothetical protein
MLAREGRRSGPRKALAVEMIASSPGSRRRGVHVMAIEWEVAVPEIVEAAGLLPRPRADG